MINTFLTRLLTYDQFYRRLIIKKNVWHLIRQITSDYININPVVLMCWTCMRSSICQNKGKNNTCYILLCFKINEINRTHSFLFARKRTVRTIYKTNITSWIELWTAVLLKTKCSTHYTIERVHVQITNSKSEINN